jgi:putative Mn2+ efflux pump MntP
MTAVATFFDSLPLAQDAAEEGKKIIIAMLIVGLIFIAVIALGETSRWLRGRGGAH